jgi:hypothetical protein
MSLAWKSGIWPLHFTIQALGAPDGVCPAWCLLHVGFLLDSLLQLTTTHNYLEWILSLLHISSWNGRGPTVNTYHVIALQPVYWCVCRIYRKHIITDCFVFDRVYSDVVWQRIDQISYNIVVCLLICCLFNDIISRLHYIALDIRISE